jgi:hypothetical protein
MCESMVYCVILAEYIREMQKRGKGNRFMSREEVLQAETVQRVGLIIIFNHKYNGNLPLLRKLYSSRFSYIRFLSPFYEGSDKDVFRVYENSYQFQGYVAQAFEQYADETISHYVFIGDDLILNPLLNETNILDYLTLADQESYFERFTPLKEMTYWSYNRFMDIERAFKQEGAIYRGEIPTEEEAYRYAGSYGLRDFDLRGAKFKYAEPVKQAKYIMKRMLWPLTLRYPLVAGYSDFFVISASYMEKFKHLCGVFAAMRLWVEVAVPTAMMFSCGRIKFQADIPMLAPKMWEPSAMVREYEHKCGYRLSRMEENWPERYLYLHPVKLSKWADE